MPRKNRSNLISPTGISTPIDFNDLQTWLTSEVCKIHEPLIENLILKVCNSLEQFVRWPDKARLLCEGFDRIPEPGKETKYHKYPAEITSEANKLGIDLDGRANGPAVAAFLLAGGVRPQRYGSKNGWSIHHVYSGKFPYVSRKDTLHAARDGLHFTQSAGLVAIHPIADQMCDEYPFFSWLLRAKAYLKFGYDPDNVFHNGKVDSHGFVST